LLAVVLMAAGVMWYANQAGVSVAPQATDLPQTVTGRVVAPLVTAPPAQEVAIPALVSDVAGYSGQRIQIQGRLGHRDRSGYGWNLKFDLFDAAGNWVALKGVPSGLQEEVQYTVIGTVAKGAYGPDLHVESMAPA
ncbi:MAG: hypothetical protein Q8P02_00495, partial [Candidatus Micrarchaeota archaeon]|nr:hypothetical protein [Candidatus Micrarchaeota archaeon]